MGKLETFLQVLNAPSTKASYKSALKFFFHFLDEKTTKSNLEEIVEAYFESETLDSLSKKLESDMLRYVQHLKGKPPKTTSMYLNVVKTFFMENDVELSVKFWKTIGRRRGPGRGARTRDRIPSNRELKTLLLHMPIQGQALFLLMSSSAMRLGETLQILVDDVKFENRIIDIRAEYTKGQERRDAYFSHETKEFLEEWLKFRKDYLKQAIGRSQQYEKAQDDDRLFPFTKSVAYHIWKTALKKTGNGDRDKMTNRRVLHPHVLRKFFRTLSAPIVGVDIAEELMGHEGYLTASYRRYSPQQLTEAYSQIEPILNVFGETNNEQFDNLKQEFETMKTTLLEETRKRQELERKLDAFEFDLTKKLTKQLSINILKATKLLEGNVHLTEEEFLDIIEPEE